MGKYYVESVQNNDYSLILGMTAFYGTSLVFCNMVVDILYGVIDPSSADRRKVGGSMGEMKIKDGNVACLSRGFRRSSRHMQNLADGHTITRDKFEMVGKNMKK